MSSCLEKCNTFARSKPARVFYGIFLVLMSCVGIIRLLELSNQMADKKLGHLELVVQPEKESLFYFKANNDNAREWSARTKKELDNFLARFKYPHKNCEDRVNIGPPEKSCSFDQSELGPCSPENNYGISGSTICIFLKLRESPHWLPKLLNSSNLPTEMPSDVRGHIEYAADKNRSVAYISCEGATPVDIENIGPITFIPQRGFSLNKKTLKNEQPLVALFFEKPMKGISIAVECKLWTKDKIDVVSFNILLD